MLDRRTFQFNLKHSLPGCGTRTALAATKTIIREAVDLSHPGAAKIRKELLRSLAAYEEIKKRPLDPQEMLAWAAAVKEGSATSPQMCQAFATCIQSLARMKKGVFTAGDLENYQPAFRQYTHELGGLAEPALLLLSALTHLNDKPYTPDEIRDFLPAFSIIHRLDATLFLESCSACAQESLLRSTPVSPAEIESWAKTFEAHPQRPSSPAAHEAFGLYLWGNWPGHGEKEVSIISEIIKASGTLALESTNQLRRLQGFRGLPLTSGHLETLLETARTVEEYSQGCFLFLAEFSELKGSLLTPY